MCVVPEGVQWKVFHVERDRPEELASFPTADETYDFVYADFRKWRGVLSSQSGFKPA
jgi:hypothetical protein